MNKKITTAEDYFNELIENIKLIIKFKAELCITVNGKFFNLNLIKNDNDDIVFLSNGYEIQYNDVYKFISEMMYLSDYMIYTFINHTNVQLNETKKYIEIWCITVFNKENEFDFIYTSVEKQKQSYRKIIKSFDEYELDQIIYRDKENTLMEIFEDQ